MQIVCSVVVEKYPESNKGGRNICWTEEKKLAFGVKVFCIK